MMVGERERCLLLCMAYPEVSKQYGVTVCMAGITDEGEYRRIYPVPWENYMETDYGKRYWIEYDILEKGDYRKESYKIKPETVEVGEEVEYEEVRTQLEDRVTTIPELNKKKNQDDTSIGIIDPVVHDLHIEESEKRRKKAKKYNQQQTLAGDDIPIYYIPHLTKYQFDCGTGCTTDHDIMCEDIEMGQLYRRLRDKYDDIDTVEAKLREKFVDWMVENRDLYFMVGTHYRFKNWLIISVLYPPARKDQHLSKFT
jgi:hypothetical protein